MKFMRYDVIKPTTQEHMKRPKNNDDYQIVITKHSKYKRSNEWIESSGELSPEEIENIIKCDQVDSNEYIFFTDEENQYLDTHDNSISGEITNLTEDDLKIFKQ